MCLLLKFERISSGVHIGALMTSEHAIDRSINIYAVPSISGIAIPQLFLFLIPSCYFFLLHTLRYEVWNVYNEIQTATNTGLTDLRSLS